MSWDEKHLLCCTCWLHFVLHPFILGCIWLWVKVVLRIPLGSLKERAGVEMSVLNRCISNCETNESCSEEKKKDMKVIYYVRDHHRSLLIPLTQWNSHLQQSDFTENSWEVELSKQVWDCAHMRQGGRNVLLLPEGLRWFPDPVSHRERKGQQTLQMAIICLRASTCLKAAHSWTGPGTVLLLEHMLTSSGMNFKIYFTPDHSKSVRIYLIRTFPNAEIILKKSWS